ncbi:MAG: 50S ribosomal protein L3 N(5)-glutamine methyltransferase [Burkholderiales bacterium]
MPTAESSADELATLRDLLRFAVSRLTEAGVFFGHGYPDAHTEAAYLLCWALHVPHDALDGFLDARATAAERRRFLALVDRRTTERIPAAYLTQEAWFGDRRFFVDERVLIPRSFIGDLLQDGLQPWISDPRSIRRVLDLCTGSGCIAILAADAFPEASVDASDISAGALDVARRNIELHAVTDRVTPVESDLFAALAGRRYDLIVSNPPYVDAPSMAALPPEYRKEPVGALGSGEDGLDLTHRILAQAARHLTPDGLLVVEIGHNRGALEAAHPDTPFVWLDTHAGDEFVFLLNQSDLTSS